MKKKTKTLIVRIVAALLCTLMLVGVFAPYVSATEMPPGTLPDGFVYVYDGKTWNIEKARDNDNVAFQLTEMPVDFAQPAVTVFAGNLSTHKVVSFELSNENNYLASVELEDGYYVLFSNSYLYTDGTRNFELNGGEYRYIYIGSEINDADYGITFETTNNIFELGLKPSTADGTVVPQDSVVAVTDKDLKYPEDAKLVPLDKEDPEETPAPTQPEDKTTIFGVIGDLIAGVFADSFIAIILLAGAGIAYIVVKKKKQEEIEKQAGIDQLNDTYVK